jgi:hypothetical protein
LHAKGRNEQKSNPLLAPLKQTKKLEMKTKINSNQGLQLPPRKSSNVGQHGDSQSQDELATEVVRSVQQTVYWVGPFWYLCMGFRSSPSR